MPITNQQQADALTNIITTIRATLHHGTPDWHPNATQKTLFEGRKHPAPYHEIVQKLTQYAATSTQKTPQFLWDPLHNWTPPNTPHTPCPDHPQEPAHNCRCCKADILTGIRPPHALGKHHNIPPTP